MKKEQLKGILQLLFATTIWGCAFVAQSMGMDHLGPMSFQAIRSALAVLALATGRKAPPQVLQMPRDQRKLSKRTIAAMVMTEFSISSIISSLSSREEP